MIEAGAAAVHFEDVKVPKANLLAPEGEAHGHRVDAVGSQHKTLRVFTREEGGFHHCQVDNITIGVHTMWDWLVDVLKPGGRVAVSDITLKRTLPPELASSAGPPVSAPELASLTPRHPFSR